MGRPYALRQCDVLPHDREDRLCLFVWLVHGGE